MQSSSTFRAIVDQFVAVGSESAMNELIEQARSEFLTDDDVGYLAESCAFSSGSAPDRIDAAADVASTGGPGSLSTLMCPLFLRSFGFKVPKLGVPGRPAGGVDVLAQIPGFKFSLTRREASEVLKRVGYVHFLADDKTKDLDATLFAYRRKTSAVALPALVIASLLAKKLTLGLTKIGLDVRVAPFGNFGGTWDEARKNAARFCRVASKVGISSICFLTDGSTPSQPYIGRGESLVALANVFHGRASGQLDTHVDLCYAMARAVSETNLKRPTIEALRDCFEKNVTGQGGDLSGFSEKVRTVIQGHRFTLTAPKDGFISVDLGALRKTLVTRQSQLVSPGNRFPDPLGLILKAGPGQFVTQGSTIATVRAESDLWSRTESELKSAFSISQSPIRTGYFEEVRCA